MLEYFNRKIQRLKWNADVRLCVWYCGNFCGYDLKKNIL